MITNYTHQPTQTSVLRRLNDRHKLAVALIEHNLLSGAFVHAGAEGDEQALLDMTRDFCTCVGAAYLLPARKLTTGRQRLLSSDPACREELLPGIIASSVKITRSLIKRVVADLDTDIVQIRQLTERHESQPLDFGHLFAWRIAVLIAIHCLSGQASPIGAEDDHVAARSLVVPFSTADPDWRTLASLHFVSQAVQQMLASEILHLAHTVIAEDQGWETVLAILSSIGVPLTLATAVLRGRDRLPLAA